MPATSVGSNLQEADGASSHDDFIAKVRISLKEANETRFRLMVCRRCDLLDERFDALIEEADQIVRIPGKIVHPAIGRRAAQSMLRARRTRGRGPPNPELPTLNAEL